ncbi:MAG TPA: BON domain-containing protein [Usitatibacter sp.]|nr:BON domain-containing protein [Usitatibacter sp.]
MKSNIAAVAAALASLAMAGCDRDSANRAENATRTTGQKIDRALDQTGQKLAEAGDKLKPKLEQAGADIKPGLERAGEKISAAAEKTGEKISATAQRATAGMKESITDNSRVSTSASGTSGTGVSVSTGERTSLTGISPETRATLGDTAITASIKADYLKDPDLSVLRIDVDTTDGVVTLNGTAESDAARKRAEQLAAAQKGVKQVRNYLTLKRG